jgi:hypothetical protein
MNKLKSFLKGFDYAVKNYDRIEDHHFHSLPGSAWHDQSNQKIYRKSILIGRKYMQYRYEIIACVCIFLGILLLVTL